MLAFEMLESTKVCTCRRDHPSGAVSQGVASREEMHIFNLSRLSCLMYRIASDSSGTIRYVLRLYMTVTRRIDAKRENARWKKVDGKTRVCEDVAPAQSGSEHSRRKPFDCLKMGELNLEKRSLETSMVCLWHLQ
jgi:hypothetical protein